MNLLRRLLGEMETPRLVLRHWRESDLEDFLAFAADPAVMLDSGARPATTFEEEQAFFRRALWDSGCYAIVLKETGRPIGKIKFQKDIRRPKGNSLSIGYELARAYWGRGYMTEALAAMATSRATTAPAGSSRSAASNMKAPSARASGAMTARSSTTCATPSSKRSTSPTPSASSPRL